MAAHLDLPSPEQCVRQFVQRHGLRFTREVRYEQIAINSTSTAFLLVNQGYAGLSDDELDDPVVGLLLNLLHRNYEHVEAAVVAFVSGCGSSAEVIARASVEASVNILYILAGDRQSRVAAYFYDYLHTVDRQVKKWKNEISHLSSVDLHRHTSAISNRERANSVLRDLVTSLFESNDERWPSKIEERFRGIGDSLGYRTIYARMSSEVHNDAEETLRNFFGHISGNEELPEAMALETVWMTRLYVYFAALLLLKASLAYARCYLPRAISDRLGKEITEIDRELVDTSPHVGAGF